MVAASIGARPAADRTSAAPTGLRLCGMVEEPPRPGPEGSAASPTSTCIISEMSRAALASAPTTSAASCASAATRTRWVNQGAAGSSSFRRLASAVITGSALSPSAERLPEAPPN